MYDLKPFTGHRFDFEYIQDCIKEFVFFEKDIFKNIQIIDKILLRKTGKRKMEEFKEKLQTLTEREFEVLQSLKETCNYKQTAEKLCISETTLKTHVNAIFGKLQVNSLPELISKYSDYLAFKWAEPGGESDVPATSKKEQTNEPAAKPKREVEISAKTEPGENKTCEEIKQKVKLPTPPQACKEPPKITLTLGGYAVDIVIREI